MIIGEFDRQKSECRHQQEKEVDAENGDDDDMIQILNDVEELLGEPVFVTL